MKKVIDFLSALHKNNHRDWFEAHRPQYTEALAEFNAFAEQLIAVLPAIDPAVAGLTLKDCTYRIYRDVRFSHDKSPYKTYMGCYVSPHGKKAGYAGYYFHVEPGVQSLISAGLYMPESYIFKSVRDEIFDNGAAIEKAIAAAKGFQLEGEKLMRVPRGYPADSPYAELLKRKDLSLYRPIDEAFLLAPDLLDRVVAEFRKCVGFNALLNRAVVFAIEERK